MLVGRERFLIGVQQLPDLEGGFCAPFLTQSLRLRIRSGRQMATRQERPFEQNSERVIEGAAEGQSETTSLSIA